MSKLYIVGTPIGNLGDLSSRAIQVLNSVDFVAAEDTRVAMKLLNHFEIKKPLISYFEHNIRQRGQIIVDRILQGENCAIVTDAGMPCISDPGEDLVKLCYQQKIPMEVVPGPSAVISALAISGQSTSRFCFEGFLSTNKKSRMDLLAEISHHRETLVFYEAPHKLLRTLQDMLAALGDRRISVCKELTKIHESVLLTTLSGAVQYFQENTPRGEYVLVIEGYIQPEEKAMSLQQAIELAADKKAQGMSAKEAAKFAAEISGYKKNQIYAGLMEQNNS